MWEYPLWILDSYSGTRGIYILSISSKSDNDENIVVVFPPISSIFQLNLVLLQTIIC